MTLKWESDGVGRYVAYDETSWGDDPDQSMTLFLAVEEDEGEEDEEDTWTWSLTTSEEDAGFGEAELAAGVADTLEEAQQLCEEASAAEKQKDQA